MSRVTAWLVCCLIATIAIIMRDDNASASLLLNFYFLLSVPLIMQWAFEKPRKDKDQ